MASGFSPLSTCEETMAPLSPVTLTGRHVRLEPLTRDHARDLWPVAQEADTWRYMLYDVKTPQDMERWVGERVGAAEAGTAWAFLQRDVQTGKAFGSTSIFDVDMAHRKMEVGHTWIDSAHRGTVHNPEAKLLLLGFAFEGQKAVRVQLKTDARNARSRAAIAKLGAQFEGVLRNHMILVDGHVRDTAFYSIIDREWTNVKHQLQRRVAAFVPA